jgi:HEPN domain-containing protein/predicted nucleotidyltransferase
MNPVTTITNQAAIEARRAALQAELERIVRVLIEQYDPERIILFGSFVHGNIHEWSDLDLCVVKRTDTPFYKRLEEVGLLTLPRVGTEILVYTPEEIAVAREQGNYFIVGEILGKGKLLYKREATMPAHWLAFAHNDLEVAELLIQQGKQFAIACFHCQQSAEKALKAFLLHHGQAPPRSHRLEDLLNQCCTYESTLSAFQTRCITLDQYYIPTRYPYAVPVLPVIPGQTEAEQALDYARAILTDIETRIFSPSPPTSTP